MQCKLKDSKQATQNKIILDNYLSSYLLLPYLISFQDIHFVPLRKLVLMTVQCLLWYSLDKMKPFLQHISLLVQWLCRKKQEHQVINTATSLTWIKSYLLPVYTVKISWFCLYKWFHGDLILWFPVYGSDVLWRLYFLGFFNFVY